MAAVPRLWIASARPAAYADSSATGACLVLPSLPSWLSARVIGTLCGIVAALFWAAGLVAAKHGVAVCLSPADMAFHRFVWPGVLMAPWLLRMGFSNLGGVGWGRGLVILILAGPLQAISSYTGFTLAPLGHGAVIHPASAALGGLLLATLVLKEPLSTARLIGVIAIVCGLVVFAGEAITSIGIHALAGDSLFATAGLMWAVFTLCLRRWRVNGVHAAVIVGALSLLIYAPLHALIVGFQSMIAAGWMENLIQIVVQGVFAGLLSLFLFARAVTVLGAGRASTFPALVPGLTMLIGFLALGEIPTTMQLLGLAIVVVGFRFAMKP
jgi:drug/metabolite transporter (DMT)-like permease